MDVGLEEGPVVEAGASTAASSTDPAPGGSTAAPSAGPVPDTAPTAPAPTPAPTPAGADAFEKTLPAILARGQEIYSAAPAPAGADV